MGWGGGVNTACLCLECTFVCVHCIKSHIVIPARLKNFIKSVTSWALSWALISIILIQTTDNESGSASVRKSRAGRCAQIIGFRLARAAFNWFLALSSPPTQLSLLLGP